MHFILSQFGTDQSVKRSFREIEVRMKTLKRSCSCSCSYVCVCVEGGGQRIEKRWCNYTCIFHETQTDNVYSSIFLVSVNRKRSAGKPDNIVFDNTHTHTRVCGEIARFGASLYTSSVHRETASDSRRRDWRKERRSLTSGDPPPCRCLLSTAAARPNPAPVRNLGSRKQPRAQCQLYLKCPLQQEEFLFFFFVLVYCSHFVPVDQTKLAI